MRALLLLLMLPVVLPAAAATHCNDGECPCPTYDQAIYVAGEGVRYNEEGQTEITVYAIVEKWYVAIDTLGPLGHEDGLLTIWAAPESNGVPGWQRGNGCSPCPEGEWDCDWDAWLGP